MTLLHTPHATIAYDQRGNPDGVPLVLLPSGAHERSDYRELRELLPERLRTIALDWPGHGESPDPDGDWSAMRLADVAEAAVAQLAPEGAIVLGNSVGGYAAARLAIRRPELVKGLVIIDGGGFTGAPPHVRAFCSLMSHPRFLRGIYPLFSFMYMRPRTDADRRARAGAIATTRRERSARVICGMWGSFSSPEHDLREQAGTITAPALVVWGRRDPVIPLSAARRIAAAISGSRLLVLPTGHVPYTTDPSAVAAELAAFAESLTPLSAASPS